MICPQCQRLFTSDPEQCDLCPECWKDFEAEIFYPGWLGEIRIPESAPESLKYQLARTNAFTYVIVEKGN